MATSGATGTQPPSEVTLTILPTVTPVQVSVTPSIEQIFDASINQMTFCFNCPHCDGKIQVPQSWINCTIFRHAVMKNPPGVLFSPHAPKEACDKALADGLIYGCGKPFKFNGQVVEKCEYI